MRDSARAGVHVVWGLVFLPTTAMVGGCVPGPRESIIPTVFNGTLGDIDVSFSTHGSREREVVEAVLPPGGEFKRAGVGIPRDNPEQRPTALVAVHGEHGGADRLGITFSQEHGSYEVREVRGALKAVPRGASETPR